MQKINEKYVPFLIVVGALILYLPALGKVNLFDWDEINFAEAAREMIATRDYLTVKINYIPFWEKPPLFIWMQVISMKIFGINAFAARFPDAMAGIATLLTIWFAGKRAGGLQLATWWVLFHGTSILPFFYFKSGIIDPWFNLFIFLSVFFLWIYTKKRKNKQVVFSAIFAGLAMLTKGPVGLLIVGLTALVWLIITRQWEVFLNFRFLFIYSVVAVLVGGSWFLLQVLDGRSYLVADFIKYQIRLFTQEDAGHGGFLFYHFVVLFFGVFPASVVALPAFRRFPGLSRSSGTFRLWMVIIFWVVLILFTIVHTKIIHYSSMCYFPLTFLAALTITHYSTKQKSLPLWVRSLLLTLAFLIGLIPVTLQVFIHFKDVILAKGWIHDPFAVGNLQAQVHWTGWEFLPGIILIVGTLYALTYYSKNLRKQVIGILVANLIFVSSTIYIIVPRVEQYSQHAAIEFYKSLADKPVYIETWGFKSYAQYFYASKKPELSGKIMPVDSLLTGKTDKPVYIVTKNTGALVFQKRYPSFHRIKEKNGFVFFRRDSENIKNQQSK